MKNIAKAKKVKYPPLSGICVKCLGCMRLEDENFKGIWRCDYYKEAKDEQRRMAKSN